MALETPLAEAIKIPPTLMFAAADRLASWEAAAYRTHATAAKGACLASRQNAGAGNDGLLRGGFMIPASHRMRAA
jgi:hypothetical protein